MFTLCYSLFESPPEFLLLPVLALFKYQKRPQQSYLTFLDFSRLQIGSCLSLFLTLATLSICPEFFRSPKEFHTPDIQVWVNWGRYGCSRSGCGRSSRSDCWGLSAFPCCWFVSCCPPFWLRFLFMCTHCHCDCVVYTLRGHIKFHLHNMSVTSPWYQPSYVEGEHICPKRTFKPAVSYSIHDETWEFNSLAGSYKVSASSSPKLISLLTQLKDTLCICFPPVMQAEISVIYLLPTMFCYTS